MASLEEIYKELTDAYVGDATVIAKYGLDTTKTFDEQFSKFALERIIFYTVAFVVYVREKALDKWVKEVEATALTTRYGTKQWWHKMSLAWQKGYQVEVDTDGGVGYAIDDASARIIKYSAIVPDGRTIYVKVAKDSDGELTALSSAELIEFSSYINAIKPLGIKVIGQSMDACVLSVNMKVYYYGERDSAEIEKSIKISVETYINNIVFGGVVFKNKVIDAVQQVEGVSDVEMSSIGYNDNGNTGNMERTLLARSGYYKVGSWNIDLVSEEVGI
ncbi:MAG: hypothetical protein IJ180_09625 [Bacteroidales bacterium]|nr:hypothetical protein [Bacteroidales bacterium]